MSKTTEETLAELLEALQQADAVTRDAHAAVKDLRRTLKTERGRVEEIVREEVARAIATIADEVRAYLVESVDAVVAEFRRKLLE